MFPIRSLFGNRPDTGYVAAGEGFGDGEADLLAAAENLVGDCTFEGGVGEPLLYGGQGDEHACHIPTDGE